VYMPDVAETNLAAETARRLATVLRPLETSDVPPALAATRQIAG